MSAEEFESWKETVEVAEEIPELKDDIAKIEKDIKSGKYKKYTSLDELLFKEGYIKKS